MTRANDARIWIGLLLICCSTTGLAFYFIGGPSCQGSGALLLFMGAVASPFLGVLTEDNDSENVRLWLFAAIMITMMMLLATIPAALHHSGPETLVAYS